MKRDKVNRPIQIFIFFLPRDKTLSRKANALQLTKEEKRKRIRPIFNRQLTKDERILFHSSRANSTIRRRRRRNDLVHPSPVIFSIAERITSQPHRYVFPGCIPKRKAKSVARVSEAERRGLLRCGREIEIFVNGLGAREGERAHDKLLVN